MKITILTLFPEMFSGPFDHSIVKRAKEKGLIDINFINVRDFGIGKHQVIDDTSYGGGVGMVMRVDVLHEAIKSAKCKVQSAKCNEKTVLLSASGKTFKQQTAKEYSQLDHLILICGHYEGVDARIEHYIDEEISIGDFVLTGGEIPAMLIIDSVTRLIDGVITEGATEDESFSEKNGMLLEYPHYTKPQEYEGRKVPEILLSGNHPKITEWKKEEVVKKTRRIRPDLLK